MKRLLEIIYEDKLGPVYRGTASNVGSLSFDKGMEFGIHFGDKESAMHRGSFHGSDFNLKKYMLNINNPLELDDVMRWNTENIINNMKTKGIIPAQEADSVKKSIKDNAATLAKQKGTRMVAEENLLLRKYLMNLGYDGIKYKNKGEAQGDAYIAFSEKQAIEMK